MFGSSADKVQVLLLEFTECKQIARLEGKRKSCEFVRKAGDSRQRKGRQK